jgi:uncharacterized cupin superfamily protein
MSQSQLSMSDRVVALPEAPVRGVIDLRAYAAAAAPTDDWLSGRGTPAFVDDFASVVALAPVGEGRVEALPADEFLILLAGTLMIETPRGRTVLSTARSAVLPAGLSFEWRSGAGTVAIIVACPATAGAADDVVSIDEAASLQPSNPPIADLLIGPTPSCRNHSDYRSRNGEFVCGTWDSTPYHRRAMLYRHIELMHLLEGSVTFEDAAGSVTFGKGDVFLAMRGAECAWTSHVRVKKVYAIHRPA